MIEASTRAERRTSLHPPCGAAPRPSVSPVPSAIVPSTAIRALLRCQFGLEAFRPGQEETIHALLAGRDTLAVLLTGAGKSLVYQLAAQILPGATLVVSPLLALMHDQAQSLTERGMEVGIINSTLTERQADEALRQVQQEQVKLLYVTPERFEDEAFMAQAQRMEVSLLVIDEAHCISAWGHSFRPSYLALGRVAEQLGRPTLLALTATATPWVRRDITERLGMRQPAMVVRGSNRPNLFLEVLRVEEECQDRRVLQRLLTEAAGPERYGEPLAQELTRAMQGSGIVYTATTAAVRETAAWLQEWGIAADYYHGQRRKGDRERVQEAFMDGDLRVIAATNAFGLGVDKPDVRFVIHRDIPASVEAYYQEAGRAGRDGNLSRCVLIYRPGDLGRAAFLAGTGHLKREDVMRALDTLQARPRGTVRDLQKATGLGRGNLMRLIELLERQGIVARPRGDGETPTAERPGGGALGGIHLLRPDVHPDDVSLNGEARRLAYEHSRREMTRGYADLNDCRQEYILSYFGETYDAPSCTMCDNSVRHSQREAPPASRPELPAGRAPQGSPFATGDRVEHVAWGAGTVQRLRDDAATVLFDASGYKTLALPGALEQNLLRRLQ